MLKMTTERQKRLNNKLREMEEFMRRNGYLPLQKAHEFLMMGLSISEGFKEMEESRDKWRKKYKDLNSSSTS